MAPIEKGRFLDISNNIVRGVSQAPRAVSNSEDKRRPVNEVSSTATELRPYWKAMLVRLIQDHEKIPRYPQLG